MTYLLAQFVQPEPKLNILLSVLLVFFPIFYIFIQNTGLIFYLCFTYTSCPVTWIRKYSCNLRKKLKIFVIVQQTEYCLIQMVRRVHEESNDLHFSKDWLVFIFLKIGCFATGDESVMITHERRRPWLEKQHIIHQMCYMGKTNATIERTPCYNSSNIQQLDSLRRRNGCSLKIRSTCMTEISCLCHFSVLNCKWQCSQSCHPPF